MSAAALSFIILGSTVVVVAALFVMLWRERTSAHDARIAIVSGAVLSLWAVVVAVLAYRGVFRPPDDATIPPMGIHLAVVLFILAVSLASSVSLRRLLTRQPYLIRLHLWRFVGIIFLLLMAGGQAPALWALPAGIGDILIAATAPWVARHLDSPQGQRRAVLWNLLGIADLIVAVGLGIMTSPGPTQLIQTVPTTEVMTLFPMALVPTFLVPLAFMLHVVSLWQLLGSSWVANPTLSAAPGR